MKQRWRDDLTLFVIFRRGFVFIFFAFGRGYGGLRVFDFFVPLAFLILVIYRVSYVL